jgi:hypothetical protein
MPETKSVKDDAKILLNDELGGADDFGHLATLESPGDELDDLLLSCAEGAGPLESARGHERIRF